MKKYIKLLVKNLILVLTILTVASIISIKKIETTSYGTLVTFRTRQGIFIEK